MRPGFLDKRGLGYERLKELNPKIVICTISGYGATGPYRDLPSHGIAYDTWAGTVQPVVDDDGLLPHPRPGQHRHHRRARVRRARRSSPRSSGRETTGERRSMEIAQSDAAAYFDWYRIETWKAYERPDDRGHRQPSDDYERRAARPRRHVGGRALPGSTSRPTATCCSWRSEQEFWKNFCEGVGRMDLFETWPGSQVRRPRPRQHRAAGDPARHLPHPHDAPEWLDVRRRAQHDDRPGEHAADDRRRPAVPGPLPVGPTPSSSAPSSCRSRCTSTARSCRCRPRRPTVGEHTDEVLRDVLGYDAERLAALRATGALG